MDGAGGLFVRAQTTLFQYSSPMRLIHALRPCHTVQFFSCNLQRYFTLGRCEIGKYTFPAQFAYTYQTFVSKLHLLSVELRCKLPGELHGVTGPLRLMLF